MVYEPDASVRASRWTLVARLAAWMATPATAAPEASLTLPSKVAVVCWALATDRMAREQTGRKYLKLTQFSFDVENSLNSCDNSPKVPVSIPMETPDWLGEVYL